MTYDLDAFLATMVSHPPLVTPEQVERIVRERYGLQGAAERLTGERDENFKVTAAAGGTQYVLKIANVAEDPSITELQTAALLHLERVDPGLPCPRVCRDSGGHSQISFTDEAGRARTARLVSYLRGKPLALASRSAAQRAACGRLAARLGRALQGFEHSRSRRALIWDICQTSRLRQLLEDLPQLPQAGFIEDFIDQFATEVEPLCPGLRHQFVHNDLNSGNILVAPENETVITGVIDFGDSLYTARAADVAIAAVAQITTPATLVGSVTDLVQGYQELEPLESAELDVLNRLIAARIVTAVLITTWHRAKNPEATHFRPLDRAYIDGRFELARRLMALQPSHV